MTPALNTGEDIVAAVRAAAAERGVPLYRFLLPLTADPSKWLRQVEVARSPKDSTKDRVRALLSGAPLPRATGITFVAGEPKQPKIAAADLAVIKLQRVDRAPCFRCGARSDVGCRHLPWTLEGPSTADDSRQPA